VPVVTAALQAAAEPSTSSIAQDFQEWTLVTPNFSRCVVSKQINLSRCSHDLPGNMRPQKVGTLFRRTGRTTVGAALTWTHPFKTHTQTLHLWAHILVSLNTRTRTLSLWAPSKDRALVWSENSQSHHWCLVVDKNVAYHLTHNTGIGIPGKAEKVWALGYETLMGSVPLDRPTIGLRVILWFIMFDIHAHNTTCWILSLSQP
jgi:hypothetical protein